MADFVEVDHIIERCGRETVRVVVPGKPDVNIKKGEVKKILFGSAINEFKWYCEGPGESNEESSSISRAFNAVISARHAEGRRMDLRFGLEA